MDTRVQFYVLGLLFMVVSFAIFALIAILSGSISDFIKRSPHAGTYLKWLQILVFLGIVFYLLLSE